MDDAPERVDDARVDARDEACERVTTGLLAGASVGGGPWPHHAAPRPGSYESIPAPAWFTTGWKGGYMNGVWVLGLFIANVYWFSGTAFYESHAAAAVAWGFGPIEDQANAGTVMMLVHCLLAFGAITYLFFRQAREGELRQRLIEAGLDPARVAEAIRAGGGEALARAHGIPVRTRAGID